MLGLQQKFFKQYGTSRICEPSAHDFFLFQRFAFSTSSSAAVMPLSTNTAEEKLGVKPSIFPLVIPFPATVNIGGTASCQIVAAIFLTRMFGIELSTSALIVLIVTTVGASIGSPSTPGVGIVILATIVQGT